MRTTLVLDDGLLRKAKRRAAAAGTTLSEVVNQALRESFGKPRATRGPFHLITYGDPARRVAHTPADLYAAEADDDASSIGR